MRASQLHPLLTWRSMPNLANSGKPERPASAAGTSGTIKTVSRKRKSSSNELRGNLKALKAVTTVVIAYTICHLPAAVMLVVHLASRMTGAETEKFHEPFMCILAITYLNSAMNPFIYYRIIPPFRYEVRRLLCFKDSRYGTIIYSACYFNHRGGSKLEAVPAVKGG